jgi:catechol 2,3-dioxygenase-like lactoylglutathione lyase family enzyme
MARGKGTTMFDHVGIVARDLRIAGAFYRAVLEPLGIGLTEDHSAAGRSGWLVFSTGEQEASFFVVAAGRPSFWSEGHEAGRSPSHFSFRAPSRAAVDAFHDAGLAMGARNNGDPGVRRGRYYCAFLIDPDGNNIEAGVHADS